MSKMVRVGVNAAFDKFVVMKMEHGKPIEQIELTDKQAADIYHQLGKLLPDELLTIELGFSDEITNPENSLES